MGDGGMRRVYIVLDIKDDYQGDKEDIATWVEARLGPDHRVETTVYQSVEAMLEDRSDGMGAWG
jgi:hypothetical protein